MLATFESNIAASQWMPAKEVWNSIPLISAKSLFLSTRFTRQMSEQKLSIIYLFLFVL